MIIITAKAWQSNSVFQANKHEDWLISQIDNKTKKACSRGDAEKTKHICVALAAHMVSFNFRAERWELI